MIDGRVIPRNNVGRDLPVAAREMSDLSVRIKHMDELGIDVQVIYPTFFITPVSRRPDIDLAVCAQLQPLDGRHRQEAAGSFSLGAGAAVAKHGTSRRGVEVRQRERRLRRLLARPGSASAVSAILTSISLYEQASALDLPICVHSANGAFTTYDFFADDPGFSKFKLAVIGAFHSLVFHGIPQRFPKLRIGIIEVSAQWIPYAVHDLSRRFARRGRQFPANVLERKSYLRHLPDR